MTQSDVAAPMDVSVQAIRDYEIHGAIPKPENLVKLAQVLGADKDWLETGKGANPAVEVAGEDDEPELMEVENEVECLIAELRTAIAKRMKIPAEWVVVQPQLHYPKFESPVGRDFPA